MPPKNDFTHSSSPRNDPRRLLTIMIPLPLLLASAAQLSAATPPANPAVPSRRWTRMFISPMGEPFRPKSRDDDALADWFGQADRNHNGQLTIEEMQQDSERFFAALDTNHDGEIDPDEITHYEQVVAPEVISGGSFGMMEGEGMGRGSHHGHRGGGGEAGFFRTADDQHQGAGRFGLLDLPEPVVSANFELQPGRFGHRVPAGGGAALHGARPRPSRLSDACSP